MTLAAEPIIISALGAVAQIFDGAMSVPIKPPSSIIIVPAEPARAELMLSIQAFLKVVEKIMRNPQRGAR
jgi:hypothetical protein